MEPTDYNIGLYADYKGFGCVLISTSTDNNYRVLVDKYSKTASFIEIAKTLEELSNKYPTCYNVNINQPIKSNNISEIMKKYLYFNEKEFNLTNGIFEITCLMNDKKLIFSHDLKHWNELLKNFNPEVTNHRINALIMALTDFKLWYLYQNPL